MTSVDPDTLDSYFQQLLAGQARAEAQQKRFNRDLLDVLQALAVRVNVLEENVVIVARDTAQAREHLHQVRNTLTPLVSAMEKLLDMAMGKHRSTDTLLAVKAQMTEAVDGKR